jgi:hypothetical protein
MNPGVALKEQANGSGRGYMYSMKYVEQALFLSLDTVLNKNSTLFIIHYYFAKAYDLN